MNFKIFYISCFLLLAGCKKQQENVTSSDWTQLTSRIKYLDDSQNFKFQSGKFSYTFPKAKLPLQRVVLMNSSLLGYFLELGEENKLVGISSTQYVYSDKIHKLLQEDKIADIGNEQKYNIEKILSLKPDVIFTNYVENFENTYEVLRKNGIQLVFIDEYLEQEPLQKARILELFGILMGNSEKAVARYQEIEKSYRKLQADAARTGESPVVIANEMYGAQWFLPGGKTTPADYFRDAHAHYILQDNPEDKSVPKSFEEVYKKAEKASYWVNLSDFKDKKQLLSVNPNYSKMQVYNTGKLYSLYGRVKGNGNDYFESGTVRPDLILKDYIKIFHPSLFPDYTLTYMKEVK